MNDDPVRVIVVDDHPLVREGLIAVLRSRGGRFDIVGEAADGETALRMCAEFVPDVVVMDLNLPGINGVQATRQIVASSPNIAVLVLTMFEDDDSVFAAILAGARGYLLKGASQNSVADAIEAVARREAVFGPRIADRVLACFGSRPPVEPFPELTEREREVLQLLARGEPNAAIARQLGAAEKTVRNHVSNILTKLQVLDRAQAVIRARDAGYGTLSAQHPLRDSP
jgi:DNA-binding NarL/FixJ family response regulator